MAEVRYGAANEADGSSATGMAVSIARQMWKEAHTEGNDGQAEFGVGGYYAGLCVICD